MTRRVVQLLAGLMLYGVGCALMVQAGLGLDPWTVLAEGIARRTGIGLGWITIVLGALIMVLWIPLRQKPGIGTIANIVLVGVSIQLTLAIVPPIPGLPLQILCLAGGIVIVALASGLYIGARFGPGPRDGLMTGMHARLGWPIWLCRAAVEITVLAAGWLLGGTVGVGTLLFAALIGPLVHVALPALDTQRRPRVRQRPATGTHAGRRT